MKISIIGYKNHASRLENLLKSIGITPYMWNHHTDNFSNLIGSDAILVSSPNDTHVQYIKKILGDRRIEPNRRAKLIEFKKELDKDFVTKYYNHYKELLKFYLKLGDSKGKDYKDKVAAINSKYSDQIKNAKLKLKNLLIFIDCNGWQQTQKN